MTFQYFFDFLTLACYRGTKAHPYRLFTLGVRIFRFVLMTYDQVIAPAVTVIQPGDIGVIFFKSFELFLVHDTPVVHQPFLGRQFLALVIFSYGILAKNHGYLYHMSFCFEWFICIIFLFYALSGYSGDIS